MTLEPTEGGGLSLRSALGEPLVGISLSFALGIAVANFAAPGLTLSYALAAGALLAWIWRDGNTTLLVFAFAAAGLLHELQTGAARSAPFFDRLATRPVPATVEGIVVTPPRSPTGTRPRSRFELRLQTIRTGSGRSFPAYGNRIAVDLRDGFELNYGDRVRLRGTLRKPRLRRNPASFDYAGHLRRHGIHAELLSDGKHLTRLGTGEGNPLVALGLEGRSAIGDHLTRGLDEGAEVERALILAMTLGAREETPELIEDKFRYSGTLHVFAVSGLHVGIVAAVVWFFTTVAASLLRLPRRFAIIATIFAVLAYALVTGLRPSAVRAAVMASIFFGGMLMDREPRVFNSTAAAALVILLFDTNQLFRPGFQLSFGVLICIAAFATPIAGWLARPFLRDPFFPKSLVTPRMRLGHSAARKVAGLAGMSVAAWLGSMPLTWHYFGLLTPISIVANLLLIPLAFVVLATAAFSLLLAPLPLALPPVLANEANALFVKGAAAAAGGFSSVPGAHWHVPAPENLIRAPCEITVLDLPYGGASCHVAVRGGVHWLIDTGSDAQFRSKAHPQLRSYGVGRLDALLLSHGDVEHVGGAVTAITEYRPPRIVTTPADSTSPAWRAAVVAAGESEISVERPTAGEVLDLGRGNKLRVLYPPASKVPGFVADDRCLVVRLELATGWRVLSVADSGFYTERWLVENTPPELLRCDVLVRGSHSGDDSTLPSLITRAAPRAVVLAGRSARAEATLPGHWVGSLQSSGIGVFDQGETGAVRMRFRRESADVRAFLGDQSLRLKRAE